MNVIFRHKDPVSRIFLKYLPSGFIQYVSLLLLLVLSGSCIKMFVPATREDPDILVVEGLITDQPGRNTVKLSTSMPIGVRSSALPLSGCIVTISDDVGGNFNLVERPGGIYVTIPPFQGVVGRTYTLHIKSNSSHNYFSYQSLPVLLKPVPPIDTVYYEKVVLSRADDGWPTGEGCQIYLNTFDKDNICKLYRWEYLETWEFGIPYNVPNNRCWVTNNSDRINIKSTTGLSESTIRRQPINLVSNATDRLKVRYSILVNQYSLTEEEFTYWDKLQNIVEHVGSLYDIIPSSVPSNISCIDKPDENVLGYFSVSAVKSKRIFVKDYFRGMPDLYNNCENVSINYFAPYPGIGTNVWVIIDHPSPPPPYKILTYFKGCADCTVRGSTTRPDYWEEY
jgi:hypothetical protein